MKLKLDVPAFEPENLVSVADALEAIAGQIREADEYGDELSGSINCDDIITVRWSCDG